MHPNLGYQNEAAQMTKEVDNHAGIQQSILHVPFMFFPVEFSGLCFWPTPIIAVPSQSLGNLFG